MKKDTINKKEIDKLKDYKYGFSTDIENFKAPKGLNEDVIKFISNIKKEPKWMLDYRLNSYKIFLEKPDLTWGADLSGLDFNDIKYYVSHSDKSETNWDDVPEEIKNTFNKIDVILSPAIGGIVVGYEVGRQLKIETIFAERHNDKLILRFS